MSECVSCGCGVCCVWQDGSSKCVCVAQATWQLVALVQRRWPAVSLAACSKPSFYLQECFFVSSFLACRSTYTSLAASPCAQPFRKRGCPGPPMSRMPVCAFKSAQPPCGCLGPTPGLAPLGALGPGWLHAPLRRWQERAISSSGSHHGPYGWL